MQATVFPSHRAAIAYELGSQYWGKGLATAAVNLMATELAFNYGATQLSAVLKRSNRRSRRLLERIGFSPGPYTLRPDYGVEADELLFLRKPASPKQ